MTSVTSGDYLVRRRVWTIPTGAWGADEGSMQDARAMARTQYVEDFGKNPTSDDWLRYHSGDDEIIAQYEYVVKDPTADQIAIPTERLDPLVIADLLADIFDHGLDRKPLDVIDNQKMAYFLQQYLLTGRSPKEEDDA